MKYEADLSVVRAARLLLRRRRTDEEEKEEERGTDEGGDVFSAFCVVDDDDGDAFEEEEDGVEDDDDGKKQLLGLFSSFSFLFFPFKKAQSMLQAKISYCWFLVNCLERKKKGNQKKFHFQNKN